MSKRRYRIEITDMNALAQKFPAAVRSVEIPARVEQRANYSIIAKLLDCQLEVPGIKVLDDDGSGTGEHIPPIPPSPAPWPIEPPSPPAKKPELQY